MKKVTVEITEKGWVLKVQLGEKVFEGKGVIDGPGRASHYGDDFEEIEEISDDLYDAIDGFFCSDVAFALKNS